MVPIGISGAESVVQYQLSGDVHPRTGSSLASTTIWSDLLYSQIDVNTISDLGECGH